MRTKLIFTFLFFSTIAFGQDTQKWLDAIENPKFESVKLKKENFKLEYLNYDFSTLMVPRKKFLGFIGEDFQRIKIYFTSISKNSIDKEVYDLKGISIVKDNVCNFTGTIRIDQVRIYESLHYGIDDKFKNTGIKAEGLIIGKYEIREDSIQNHSGYFQGLVTLFWYTDKYKVLHFDDLSWYSDRYCNNQYVGTWTPYENSNKMNCNWGESRIPLSGDLDIGAGEFIPNPKYPNSGWNDYKSEKGE